MKYDNSLHELQDIAGKSGKSGRKGSGRKGQKMEKENIKKRHSLNCILCKLPVIFPSVFLLSPSFFSFPVSCVLRMMLPLCGRRENLWHARRYRFSFRSSVVEFFEFKQKKNI